MPNVYYDSPYLDEAEHAALNHSNIPGVPPSGALVASEDFVRSQYWGNPEPVATGGGNLSWVSQPGGNGEPLNLTDPKNPLILVAGIYAVTARVVSAVSAGKAAFILLGLDDAASYAETFAGLDLNVGVAGFNSVTLSLTWFIPASGLVDVYVSHNVGSSHNFTLTANIQRIA